MKNVTFTSHYLIYVLMNLDFSYNFYESVLLIIIYFSVLILELIFQ